MVSCLCINVLKTKLCICAVFSGPTHESRPVQRPAVLLIEGIDVSSFSEEEVDHLAKTDRKIELKKGDSVCLYVWVGVLWSLCNCIVNTPQLLARLLRKHSGGPETAKRSIQFVSSNPQPLVVNFRSGVFLNDFKTESFKNAPPT